MNALIEIVSNHIQNSNFASGFLDAWLKSFFVLALAGGLALCLPRASAATRHLIWFLGLASLPCLPLVSSVLPAWHKPLWSLSTGYNSGNQFSLSLELAPTGGPGFSPGRTSTTATKAAIARAESGRIDTTPGIAAHFNMTWLVLGFFLWFSGMALALSRMAAGWLRLRSLSREARAVQRTDWAALLQDVCDKLRLGRPVILLQSGEKVMPMTWGWWRPVVLLPAEAEQWPEERRRVVLLHELGHVKRRDCLTQAIATIVFAFYWFNPLVWLAARRMCVERERACDDLVLNDGCKSSDYANHLVEIAIAFRRKAQVTAIAMARPSGLERRVTAILDCHRNRNRVAKTTAALFALAVVGVGLFLGACTTVKRGSPERWSIDRSEVGDQLKHFAAEKETQAIAGAKAEGKEMLPEFSSMFAAAAKGDWLTISNIWEDLRKRAPQYEDPGPKDDRLHGTAWQTVLETWGAFGNIVMGGKNLVALGEDAIGSIRPGSIYFGGTDPGRCVITALQKSHVNADPFFTLTQNALADGSYLAYLRRMYGGKIYTPTDDDSKKCFDEYLADAQFRLKEGKLKDGENVKIVEGHAQVSGQVAVMAINALLAKIIFDKNPEHLFYLEESFPLDWMYPHLSPNGLILKINRQPLSELSDQIVRQDREYWTRAIQPMIGDWLDYDTSVQKITAFAARTYANIPGPDRYVHGDAAQKWASKLRSSIAGVYVWRIGKSENPAEQQRMLKEADFAFRQAVAICPYSPEAVFRYVNLLVEQNRLDDAFLVAKAAVKIQPNDQFRNLVKELKKLKTSQKK